MAPRRNNATRKPRRAFTLIEIVVAVGAVALIAVGLAAIFDAVGKTVSGGRRVSLLSQYAELIERQMRRDFENMTRDGYMVIRQQYIEGPGSIDGRFDPATDRIQGFQQDLSPKPRRADEIMFFAAGSYTTARQSIASDLRASSDVARIYYGHGLATRSGAALSSRKPIPNTNDTNDPSLPTVDLLGEPTPENPNRYASDWTLLRHVTLLAVGGSILSPTAPGALGVTDPRRLADSDYQVALQPAAPSLFRVVNEFTPPPLTPFLPLAEAYYNTPYRFASGIIDIATTNLGEVRNAVVNAARMPAGVTAGNVNDPLPRTFRPVAVPAVGTAPTTRPGAPNRIDLMHAWMDQGMPAASDPAVSGARIRYEPEAYDLIATLEIPASPSPAQRIQKAYGRADQLALVSSNFLQHCTSFIVEWSFGQIDQNSSSPNFNQLIWYGPRRWTDLNGDGIGDANDGEPSVLPYPFATTGSVNPYSIDLAPPALLWDRFTFPNNPPFATHNITERLIYGFSPAPDAAVLTSYFGYVDPSFDTDVNTANGPQQHGDAAGLLSWAWPRLIRVTLTIADPQDRSIESTFQFYFKTPADPASPWMSLN